MDLLGIAARIAHPHPIDGIRALMQDSIKDDDSLLEAVRKKRFNTFLSQDSHVKLQNIANVEFKLSTFNKTKESAEEQLANLRSGGFDGLHAAEFTLIEVYQAAGDTRGKHARGEIERLVLGLQRQAREATSYWKQQLETATRDGNRTEIQLATAWLDGITPEVSQAELAVCTETPQTQPDASQTTITAAFKAAADNHACSDAEVDQLEDLVVEMLALPPERAPADAPYTPDDFPSLDHAAQGTNLLIAQRELSTVLEAIAARPADPARASLLSLLANLQVRVGDTVLHWGKKRDQLAEAQDGSPTAERAAEIERIEKFIGATGVDSDLDSMSDAGSDDSYNTISSFGTEPPGRMSRTSVHDNAESYGEVDDLFDSSSSISWESDTGSESARYNQSSLAGFDLPFTKLPTAGGVYFGDSGRIINTRKMTLEEAFATKFLNETVSTTTIDKLDTIFEHRYGITLTTSGIPRFELSSFANPFKHGLRRPHEGLDDLAAISRRLDQMRPNQARDDLKQALALYQTHLEEAGNWWRAEAQRLAENPPPAARTDLQEVHALQLDVAMAWLADSDA